MKRALFFLSFAAILGGTLVSGWIHGALVQRWQQADNLKLAAGRLGRELPPRLGPWRLANTLGVETAVAQTLRIAGHLHGVYTSEQTGDTVVVAVLAGPSGPLSVHTPEVCYSANDYELAGKRQPWSLVDSRGQKHSLWEIHANSRSSTRPNLRVLYGWSRGGAWEAVSGPRFALAGLPLVYKLQVAGPVRDHPSNKDRDPCEDFLSRFLGDIQTRLVPESREMSLATRSSRKEPSP